MLVGSAYWAGLLDWIRGTLLTSGAVSESDIDLLQISDDPDEVVAIMRAHADDGPGPDVIDRGHR